MVELWHARDIDKNTKPREMYEMDEIFEQYEKRAVAAGLNKWKAKMGAHIRDDDDKKGESHLLLWLLMLL